MNETETQADDVEAEVVVLTNDEIWGEPDPHADDPDEDAA